MASIILGVGTSHSPVLALPGRLWEQRADADRANPQLSLADGRLVTYDQLVAERGEPFGDTATLAAFDDMAATCQAYLDRIADAVEAARPDVVIIVGDDQNELYTPGNIPAIALFWGDQVVTHSYDDEVPEWLHRAAPQFAMDHVHCFPGHPDFALELINGLIARDVDIAVCKDVPDPAKAGFGHAFGFPVERLFRGREIPIIPILLNTYYPPNVLSPARCVTLGAALADVIENSPSDLKVAIIASGGLSHFVVEEELDRQVIDNLDRPDRLAAIDRAGLVEGSSEILNWIMTAAAMPQTPLRWREYVPARRTPAGTGIGLAFAIWSKEEL